MKEQGRSRIKGGRQGDPLVVSLVLATLVATFGCAPWREYSSEKGGFSILLPGRPGEWDEKLETPIGSLNVHWIHVATRWSFGEGGSCFVSFADLPDPRIDPNTTLKAAQEGLVRRFTVRGKGDLSHLRSIEFGGYPGSEFQIKVFDGLVYKVRAYVVRGRLYQLIVGGELAGSTRASSFFESFRVNGIDHSLRVDPDPAPGV